MSRELYLQPTEIKIDPINGSESIEKEIWYDRILSHELEGLSKMGSDVDIIGNDYILVSHPENKGSYLNRVMNISMKENDFEELVESTERFYSFIINPFTTPYTAQQLLEKNNFINSRSSIILGGVLTDEELSTTKEFDIKVVNNSEKEDFKDLFYLFSSYFLKTEESYDSAFLRLKENINKGTHVLALKEDKPVGFVGTIDIGSISSIYCGLVVPEYRGSNAIKELVNILRKELKSKGVEYYYGKSNNKGVLFGLRIMFGFNNLYNEKVFTFNV